MATTVKVRDKDKAVLDALQAKMTLAAGKRIALHEVVSRLVQLALRHEDELVTTDEARALTPEEIKTFLSGTTDWGVVTTEDQIDRILYGDDEPE